MEAEISDSSGHLLAVLFEDGVGWHIEKVSIERLADADLNQFLDDVKQELSRYLNRRGIHAPPGLTKAGLAMWLLKKEDGIAKDDKFGSSSVNEQ